MTPDPSALQRITSFAVISSDWHEYGRSYIDNFIPFLVGSIPHSDTSRAISTESIAQLIEERFRLRLPDQVVSQLLKRAAKDNLVTIIQPGLISLTDKGRRSATRTSDSLRKLESERIALSSAFAAWTARTLGSEIGAQESIEMILDYVETYHCSLVAQSENDADSLRRLPQAEPQNEHRVVAAFIADEVQKDPALLESLGNIAKGSLLVSALFAPSAIDATSKFDNTTIYLDTRLLFRLLGYEGQERQTSTSSLVQLLKSQGARIAIFDFTFREATSVLNYVAQKARQQSLWESQPGSVESYFYRLDAPASEIERHIVSLESAANTVGVEVDPAPNWTEHRFVIDEDDLKASFLRENPNYRDAALRHDIQTISAIVRARRNRARNSLEKSRATFMTLNSLVVKTARSLARELDQPWPLVMFESDITALTWVKRPDARPNLPRDQLVSTSLSLLNPSRSDWGRYTSELSRLMQHSEITEAELSLLRQKFEYDKMAFVRPIGDPQNTSTTSIRISVAEAKSTLHEEATRPLVEEMRQVRIRDEALQQALDQQAQIAADRSEKEDQLHTRILRRAWARAKALEWAVTIVLFSLGLVFVIQAFSAGPEISIFGFVVQTTVVYAILAFTGGLTSRIPAVGRLLRRLYINRTLRFYSLTEGDASRLGYEF